MEQQILKDVSVTDRERILRDTCDKTEELTYQKKFLSEEITIKKDEAIQKASELFKLIKSKKDAVSEFNAKIKHTRKVHIALVNEVKTGVEEVTEQVFLMSDQESSMMGYYNNQGELVYSRPLLPNEKQLSILQKAQ